MIFKDTESNLSSFFCTRTAVPSNIVVSTDMAILMDRSLQILTSVFKIEL